MARREINVFNIAFLDLISGALGAVIILYVAVPKNNTDMIEKREHQALEIKQETLQRELTTSEQKIKKLEEDLKSIKKEKEKIVSHHESEIEEAKKAIEKVKKIQQEQHDKISSKKDKKSEKSKSEGVKAIGFDFKGKNLVFIIDVSGSMETNDLIGEVKAGLKMLVTSLTKEYEVDVVFFPDGKQNNYRALWGRMKPMTKENKDDIYTYLRGLIPFGATPTRSVLNYALDQYPEASDIILLSDGAPSRPNSSSTDDINDIVSEITKKNKKRNNVQINSLGVGPDFRFGERESSKLYQFLFKLSDKNSGFFHGF
jgi:Mg-chelatase subunit ChlD